MRPDMLLFWCRQVSFGILRFFPPQAAEGPDEALRTPAGRHRPMAPCEFQPSIGFRKAGARLFRPASTGDRLCVARPPCVALDSQEADKVSPYRPGNEAADKVQLNFGTVNARRFTRRATVRQSSPKRCINCAGGPNGAGNDERSGNLRPRRPIQPPAPGTSGRREMENRPADDGQSSRDSTITRLRPRRTR